MKQVEAIRKQLLLANLLKYKEFSCSRGANTEASYDAKTAIRDAKPMHQAVACAIDRQQRILHFDRHSDRNELKNRLRGALRSRGRLSFFVKVKRWRKSSTVDDRLNSTGTARTSRHLWEF